MAKIQYVLPPDAGATNAGQIPTRAVGVASLNGSGRCGRGIRRYGDIRHQGDLIPSEGAAAQTGVWTPGTIGQNVVTPRLDNDNAWPSHDRGADGNAFPETLTSPGKFDGFSASGEGFDPYSGQQGGQS